jgi:hypothetical protein
VCLCACGRGGLFWAADENGGSAEEAGESAKSLPQARTSRRRRLLVTLTQMRMRMLIMATGRRGRGGQGKPRLIAYIQNCTIKSVE